MTIVNDLSAPLVVVVGSTGVQGGSVIRELARSDRPYRIRGLTRDPTKPAAQGVAKEGVEVHAANIVVANKEAVFDAFKGGDIAFLVTNYMEHMQKQREIEQGKLMIDAALAGGVKKIIWSGLQSIVETSAGKYTKVDMFDGKWEVTIYGRERVRGSGISFINVDAGSYTANYAVGALSGPQPKGDGTYTMKCPIAADTKLPIIDMEHDYGLFVRYAIESPDFAGGGEILTASEMIGLGEMAQQLSEVTGKKVTYEHEDPQDYLGKLKAIGWGTDHLHLGLVEMMLAFNEVGYYCGKPAFDLSNLPRKTRSWKEFAEQQDWSKLL
ncbi:NAD(P)-binding protein [Auricularia subglabra TFB-10046 SS5]|nr:NAD(P)-binding protein [Auricularia subglabra TFB-10046 SS5]